MSEEAATPPVEETPANTPAETPIGVQLQRTVTETLAASSERIKTEVITSLVNQELAKRTTLVLKGIAAREETVKGIKKIQPDQAGYSADGKLIEGTQSYTKAKADELKKARENLAAIDKALEEALSDKPNYEKLGKIVKE